MPLPVVLEENRQQRDGKQERGKRNDGEWTGIDHGRPDCLQSRLELSTEEAFYRNAWAACFGQNAILLVAESCKLHDSGLACRTAIILQIVVRERVARCLKGHGTAPAKRVCMNIKFCTAPVSGRLHGWKRMSRRVYHIFTASLLIQFGC